MQQSTLLPVVASSCQHHRSGCCCVHQLLKVHTSVQGHALPRSGTFRQSRAVTAASLLHVQHQHVARAYHVSHLSHSYRVALQLPGQVLHEQRGTSASSVIRILHLTGVCDWRVEQGSRLPCYRHANTCWCTGSCMLYLQH